MNYAIPFLRERFNYLVETLDQYKGANLVPQSSYLRIDKTLENGVGSYEFDPLLNNGGASMLEKKLDKNDLFFISSIGVFLTAKNITLPADVVMLSTVNPDELKASISAAGLTKLKTDLAAATGLNTIYNGFVSLRTGQEVTLQNLPMWSFNRISDDNAGVEGSSVILPESIQLNGSSDQRFTLSFNGAGTTMQNATSPTYEFGVSLFLTGFLVKGGARIIEVTSGI